MQDKFGVKLKREREAAGLSVEEVCTKLSALGFKISPKTLYGYENDVSAPKISLFMSLCKIYDVSDIYGTFGDFAPSDPSLSLNPHERQVLLAYRAHPEARPFVDKLLGVEPEQQPLPKQA